MARLPLNLIRTASAAFLALAVVATSGGAVVAPPAGDPRAPRPNLDVRGEFGEAAATPAQRAALAVLEKEVSALPGGRLVVRLGPFPGTIHHLFRREGYLTAEAGSGRDAEDVARQFLAAHADAFGLSVPGVRALALERRMEDPGTRAVHLQFSQQVDGLRVFHGEVRVHLDSTLRILSVGGDTAPEHVLAGERTLDAAAAVVLAARSVGVMLDAPLASAGRDERGESRFVQGPLESAPWAAELWFPTEQGLRAAWRVVVDPRADQGWYQVVLDARTGAVLHRHDLVQNIATEGLAFREDPGQGPQLLLPFVDNAVVIDAASPLGWSAMGESRGNNCDVKDDIADDDEGTDGRRATAAGPDPLSFSFPFQDDPALDLDASITNLFYLNNWLHDRLARLGFDEAAGNFQADNFGRGGRGADAVFVDAQDGSGRNNANFGTPADGSPPRMQMYVWTFTNPNRDSGFDSSVVTHELFHGVSNRLVGGADDAGCLSGPQSGAMGEAWSDFYACTFWDQVTVGGYLVNNYVRGIRRAAYDAYPFGYGELCNQGGFEVHRDGEIWAATLWSIRQLFVARDGYHAGKCRVERLVLDGMKLSPCRPSFVDMRDAILLAGRLSGAPGDVCLLWQGFAARGLGVSAVSTAACTTAADAANDVPPECAACTVAAPVLLEADASAPNRVTLRFTPGAGATEHLLLRSAEPCDGFCAGTTFGEVARGTGTATELVDADAPGNALSVGSTWAYRVVALEGAGCTAYSTCANVIINGRCTLPPTPALPGQIGVLAIGRPPGATCSITVSWASLVTPCGNSNSVRYNVYRSTDPAFVPGPEHLVASVFAPQSSFTDRSAPPADLTYVVRAEDLTTGGEGPHGGNEEGNLARLTLAPQGLEIGVTTFVDDAEGGELPGYVRTGSYDPNDWAIVSDGNTRGGSAWRVTDVEGGNADKNLHLPPLSLGAAPRLVFQHSYQLEDCFDGGVAEISTDGGLTWTDLLADLTAGAYDTSQSGCGGRTFTVADLIHAPNVDSLWTGQNAAGFGTYDQVTADLAAYAGTLDARIRLRCLVDALAAEPGGWYVDDLTVQDVRTFDACASACTDPPRAVLPDVIACRRLPGEEAVATLDASASMAGAVGLATDLAFVLTHDGPGSFSGRRWAEGPVATLTFPASVPAGPQSVTLTVRGRDGCAATVVAQVVVEDEIPPAATVGGTLRVARDPQGLALSWGDVGVTDYNIHVLALGADLRTLSTVPASRTVAGRATETLDLPAALPGGGTLFVAVYSASSCGLSLP